MLIAEAEALEAAWGEGGTLRVALHTIVGGLGGGLSGAVASATTASVIPHLDSLLAENGLSADARKAVLLVASAWLGELADGPRGVFNAVGQTVNNYLSHAEATQLEALKKTLYSLDPKCDDCNRAAVQAQIDTLKAQIAELNELDRLRDEYAKTACNLPSSPACGQVVDELIAFRQDYIKANLTEGLFGEEKSQSQDVLILLDLYRARAARPDVYNNVKGVANTLGSGLELAVLAGKAAAGDGASQAALKQLAEATKQYLSDPIDNTQRAIVDSLQEIDRLEAAGRTDEAQQKRAELFAEGVFTVTGAGIAIGGTKVVIRGTSALANQALDATADTVDRIRELAERVKAQAGQEGVQSEKVAHVGTHSSGNNGSFEAEGDFGYLNQSPKIPSNINTAINDKVKVVDKDNLPFDTAETFRRSEYVTVETVAKVSLFRKFGGVGNQAAIDGAFATTAKNAGRQETAVYPKWSSSRFEAEIEVPPGEKLNIGKVSEHPFDSSSPKYRGGADQVLLPRNYPLDWIKTVRDGKTGKIYSIDEFRVVFPDQFRDGR